MSSLIRKSFGGLSVSYYIRQFIFGLIFPALFCFASFQVETSFPWGVLPFLIINSLLYPYSRFVYESIMGFIMGENVFFLNALFVLIVKFMTMMLCWGLAIFIAPLGLLFLYFYHSKRLSKQNDAQ